MKTIVLLIVAAGASAQMAPHDALVAHSEKVVEHLGAGPVGGAQSSSDPSPGISNPRAMENADRVAEILGITPLVRLRSTPCSSAVPPRTLVTALEWAPESLPPSFPSLEFGFSVVLGTGWVESRTCWRHCLPDNPH